VRKVVVSCAAVIGIELAWAEVPLSNASVRPRRFLQKKRAKTCVPLPGERPAVLKYRP